MARQPAPARLPAVGERGAGAGHSRQRSDIRAGRPRAPAALAICRAGTTDCAGPGETRQLLDSVSPEQYQHMASIKGISSMGLIKDEPTAFNVSGDGTPEQVYALLADRGLLPTLGVRMQLGRDFSQQEDSPNGPRAVILTAGYWLRRFGGAPTVIGQRLSVEGVPHTIVGVLPASFDQFGDGDIMLPLAL